MFHTHAPSAILVIRGANGDTGSAEGKLVEGDPSPDIPDTLRLLDELLPVEIWGLAGNGVGSSWPELPLAGVVVEELEDWRADGGV